MSAIRLTAVVFLSFFLVQAAFACEPCLSGLSLEESVQKADLIVIATNAETKAATNPGVIKVTVQKVLKGMLADKSIKVKSWSGMCLYDIGLAPHATALLILVAPKKGKVYATPNYGCATRQLGVKDGKILVEKQEMRVEDFKAKYLGKP